MGMAMGIFCNEPLYRSDNRKKRRHHLHESVLQKAVRQAVGMVEYPNQQLRTRFAIFLPRTCSKMVMIFGPAQRCEHDNDLHPCAEPGWQGSPEPGGFLGRRRPLAV